MYSIAPFSPSKHSVYPSPCTSNSKPLHSLIAIAYIYAYSYTFLKIYIFGIIMLYKLYDYTLYLNIFIHINEIL